MYNDLYVWVNPDFTVSLQTMRVHQNGDEAFDAIVVDEQQNQIIIGAK